MSETEGNGFSYQTDTLTAPPAPPEPEPVPPATCKNPSHPHSGLDNFRMDRPWGRVLAGRIDELTRGGHHQAQLLVASLWVAHRAARRLRRNMILQRKAARGEGAVHHCPDCGDDEGPGFCPYCHAIFILTALVRPCQNGLSEWELGRTADELAWVLPWFDVQRAIDGMEAQFAGWYRQEEKAEADPPFSTKG